MAEPDDSASGRAEPQVIAERREKLERLRDDGVEPFPAEFAGRTEIAAVHAAHDGLEADRFQRTETLDEVRELLAVGPLEAANRDRIASL